MSADDHSEDSASFTTAAEAMPTLEALEKLGRDEYVVTFGPQGRQFCATPNGYAAVNLPVEIHDLISNGTIKKIYKASLGSVPDSWFFYYETSNGQFHHQLGNAAPSEAKSFISMVNDPGIALFAVHVQLGDDESFVAWNESKWVCSHVPKALLEVLCQLSSEVDHKTVHLVTGHLRKGSLNNVQWHRDGSWYVKTGHVHLAHFEANVARNAWKRMWVEGGLSKDRPVNKLAYVAIDPHALVAGDTFVFVKRRQEAGEVIWVLRFGEEKVYHNIKGWNIPVKHGERMISWEQKRTGEKTKLAVVQKSGRPHGKEGRELFLNKGDTIKVHLVKGRGWYIAEDKHGITGWVHTSTFAFQGGDAAGHDLTKQASYYNFEKFMEAILKPGAKLLTAFPPMEYFVDDCAEAECQESQEDGSSEGFCFHNVADLLKGSGCYSYEWLKDERNMWHPDRFGRFCNPDHADRLKVHAQRMFVIYGQLMDKCKK